MTEKKTPQPDMAPAAQDADEIEAGNVQEQSDAEVSKSLDDRVLDEAAKYLATTNDYGPMTPEQEKKIVKKIDAWMIPLCLFTATLGAVDKVQMGTASLYGFQTDNHMKYHATQRLAENRTGIASKTWKWDQVWEALLDIKIWIIFFFNIVINIPNGGLVNFGSIIIKDLGYTSLEASLLTMPFGILATSSAWLFSYIAARWHNRRTLVACFALLLPILGTALVYGLPRTNIAGQMVGLYFMYFYWPPYVIGISLPQANTAGQTKKAICYSLVQIGYAAGNLIGPQTFIAKQAPKYTGAVIAMLTSYCVCMLLMLSYWFIAAAENKRRDRKYGKPEAVHEGTVEGFVDITDKKQHDFRYTT
ncbi:putative allantoate permease protein [Phaeoacremonium minimum UCRPA7]|uniref:Putative allantoate permease protein n=1 Tax=Phaeoacremonium minimum (strain UCR-PA7) TaxID=1286976 RepID=R8BDJ7_PHAM7|nr:putative allantoate permease protein [Phaeoacremonium minimum UCRPA7]EON97374.1 putative allantoate permease protein [Phaeoacremonium minimum UCRPA7]